jgi:hypothetical protein
MARQSATGRGVAALLCRRPMERIAWARFRAAVKKYGGAAMPAWRAEYPMPDVGRALVASLFRSNKTEKCKLATVGFPGILGERSGGMTGSLGGISRDACNAYRMGINNQSED